LFTVSSAFADEPSAPEDGGQKGGETAEPPSEKRGGSIVEGSVGIKFMPGASVLTTPSGLGDDETFGFKGNGGGFSWGLGIYGEVRFFKAVGLELDILRDQSVVKRNVTRRLTGTAGVGSLEVQEKFELTSWRIPLLLKGNVPVGFGRLFVLVGPEFVIASNADASVEERSKSGTSPLPPVLSADKSGYTLLTTGLGLAVNVWRLEIPFELRASYNMGLSNKWADRVTEGGLNAGQEQYTVSAQASWDFRMSLGLGYRFE